MGQAASRTRPSNSQPDQPPPSPPSNAPSKSSSSCGLSLRRTVRALIPHSRSTSDHPPHSKSITSLRKRWRSSSKRFSKTPSTLSDLSDSTPHPLSQPQSPPDSLSPHNHPSASNPSLSRPSSSSFASPIALCPTPGFPVHSSPLSPNPLSHSDQLPVQTPLHPSLLPNDNSPDLAAQIDRDIVDFLSTDRNDLPPERDPPPAPQSASQPSHPRHFQPPGPLVVVQGVVNTSDNPAVSQLSPPEDRQARGSLPLASLIPRPSSMLNRPPSNFTQDRNSLPSHDTSSLTDVSNYLGDLSTPDSPSTGDDMPPAADSDSHPTNDNDSRPRPLSPGSIDVLGTLLSVAAAATAASLFSPSLGFQNHADSVASPPSGIPRPMSPTPTAGLAGGDTLRNPSSFGIDPTPPSPLAQQSEGRERIRNVWDNFRERLGLNLNRNRGSDDSSGPGEQSNMRPGEIMLAEMARALNIGLGLNGDGSRTESLESNVDAALETGNIDPLATTSAGRTPPPEDSFERFLYNLQADLRVALSEDTNSDASVPLPLVASAGRQSSSNDDTANPHLPIFDELPMQMTESEDDDQPPPLEDVSDDEDDVFEDHGYGDTASTRTPTPMPASAGVTPNRVDQSSSRNNSRDENGNADPGIPGINLWRLYRFQPIPASQVAGHAVATTSPAIPLSSIAPVTSSAIPVANPPLNPIIGSTPSTRIQAANGASLTSGAAPSPPAPDAGSNMVVPVIVVGLQSVAMGQAHGHAHSDSDTAPSVDLHDTDRRAVSASFDEDERASTPLDGPSSGSGSTTPRGRTWQSRAATALRNLRPGRRNGSRERRTADGASRTFLIYVIGGYYPPNHHMVTGSDNLDSYEALWELAELLGQVKPPVATREEIDKSGLQIVKSSDLDQLEQRGRVASNCIERCLICLDDYGQDDDLRLMTCKHAFHKDCVDRWLQVGRNNCPACRSKGVSTSGDSL